MSDASFRESLDRVLQGKVRRKSRPDPRDIREYDQDRIAGRDRKPEIWVPVMERHGFRWFEPEELDRVIGMQSVVPDVATEAGVTAYWKRPNKEGMWRRHKSVPSEGIMALAFTLPDLISSFGTPEKFAEWIEDIQTRARARHAGIVLPPRNPVRARRPRGKIITRAR